jgi:hydrogenase large subunit
MIELIEKIEGEAKLDFSFDGDKIKHVGIEFISSRHIENILKGKDPLDALVINPRVCGICGHAHLIATVKALEDCYDDLKIPKKAEIIRELTLNFELIQNHFKWLYLVIFPLLGEKQNIYKATHPSQLMAKAIATVAGQYPHNSYAIVGGITSEILQADLIKLDNIINEMLDFYQKNLIDVNLEDFISCENIETMLKQNGDLPELIKIIKEQKLEHTGKSFDRFIVFGENSYFKSGKANKTRVTKKLHLRYLKESINEKSYAKNVTYKDRYFEVGPLSRAMINKTPLIKDAHRRYKDSMLSRILARVCEIPQLLLHSGKLIKQIDLSEPSYIKPNKDISFVDGEGVGYVEAARGSLIHQVKLEDGYIKDYQIITPTQWNLSNGSIDNPGIAQKAMVGLHDTKIAEQVFKSFDVCSVCTTH